MKHAACFAGSFLLLASFASAAYGQDAVAVDPNHYTLEFENEYVRVLRIKYGPDEISVMHEHPAGIAIPLTPGQFRMHLPDETTDDIAVEAGQPIWAEATKHRPHNIGDQGAELILIELKGSGEEGVE